MKHLKILLFLVAVLPLCGFRFLSGLENEKANKLYKKGQIGKAKSVYTQALKSDPNSPEVAYNLGNALFREGLFKESQSNYLKSTAQKSEDNLFKAKVFYNLGNSQYRQKDLANAADSYKKSLRLNPKDEDAKYNLELVLKQMEKEKKDPEKDQKKDQNQDQGEGQDKGEGAGGGAGSEGVKDQKPAGGSEQQESASGESKEPKEEKGSQQEQDKQQSEEGKDREAAEKKEQEKADQPKSDAQLRAEQLLGALENQEQQVLKFQNSQNGPRSRVRRVAEQDW